LRWLRCAIAVPAVARKNQANWPIAGIVGVKRAKPSTSISSTERAALPLLLLLLVMILLLMMMLIVVLMQPALM